MGFTPGVCSTQPRAASGSQFPGDTAVQPHRVITLDDAAVDRNGRDIKRPDKPAPARPYNPDDNIPAHTLIDKDGYVSFSCNQSQLGTSTGTRPGLRSIPPI